MRIKINKANIGIPLVVRSSYKFTTRTYGIQEAEITLTCDGEYILTVDGSRVIKNQMAVIRGSNYTNAIIDVSTRMRQAIEAYNDAYVSLASRTIQIRSRNTVEKDLAKIVVKRYARKNFSLPKPNKSEVESDLREEAESKFFSVWSVNTSRKNNYIQQNLEVEYNKRVANWNELKKYHESIQDYFESQKNEQYQQEYNLSKKAFEDDLYGDVTFVTKKFNELPSSCVVPFDVSLESDYNQKDGIINAVATLPSLLNIPDKKVESAAYNKISVKEKLKRELEADTTNTLLGLAYYLAGHLFSLSVNIKLVRLSVMTGYHAYYWVEFERNGFMSIPFSNMSPLQDFFNHPNVIDCRGSVIELIEEYAFKQRIDEAMRISGVLAGNKNLILMSITQAEKICRSIEGTEDLKQAVQDAKANNSTVVIANKRYQNLLSELAVD